MTTSEEPITEAEVNLQAAEDDGSKVPLFKFILTGGPCGGKTTAIARLSTFLKERGFEVIACAEVYTIFASNGMSSDFYSTDGMDLVIQNSVLDVQLSLEDSLEKVLKVSNSRCDFVSQLKRVLFFDTFFCEPALICHFDFSIL